MEPEPGEEIFFHGHPSWRAMLGFYVKGIAASVLVGALTGVITALAAGKVKAGWVAVVVVLGCLIVLGVGFVRRFQTTYTISNQRLTIDHGIFSRALHQTRLERVQNVSTSQSLLERVLRVGTVDFDTAGEAGYAFAFRGVSDPHAIVRTVDQASRESGSARSGSDSGSGVG
jgi:uncharacterized membrane protein YdbT with pleckstrin-like domain